MIRAQRHAFPTALALPLAALLAHGCGGDAPASDPGAEQAGAAPAAEAPARPAAPEVGQASLSIGGGQVAYPGRFELLASCDFTDGILTVSLVSGGDISGGPNMATLSTSEPAGSLAEGSYPGRYDVTEEHEDGNVERYPGDAEISVAGMSQTAEGTVATIEAGGMGDDGVTVELMARCIVSGA